jgi:hypothetical protein
METRSSIRWKTDSGVKNYLNLKYIDFDSDFPILDCQNVLFDNVVVCNNYKKITNNSLISMFIDDYVLERFWRNPTNYINKFNSASVVMSPDFSLLVGMPKPLVHWQTYRNRLIGRVWMNHGINIIPTISWSDKKSFDIVFKGIQKNSIVAVSNIGCRNKEHLNFFESGYNEMIKQINPKKIIFMCNKKYKNHFNDNNVVFIESYWDNKRKN